MKLERVGVRSRDYVSEAGSWILHCTAGGAFGCLSREEGRSFKG